MRETVGSWYLAVLVLSGLAVRGVHLVSVLEAASEVVLHCCTVAAMCCGEGTSVCVLEWKLLHSFDALLSILNAGLRFL